MSTNTTGLHHGTLECDVCVVGGGMAGLCAAIASARHGATTILVHDRAVLGGNASSEIRMWICGARGDHNKETGILEEIQLENAYRNPAGHYNIWDTVLYEKAFFQTNLTTLLNTSCLDACVTKHGDQTTIESIDAWQLTSQTRFTIHAKQFIDCSGDSILAPLTGADTRAGREARHEFDEDIEPSVADGKTMGNSLLIQIRRTDEPQPFIAPKWAYKFESPDDMPHRMHGLNGHNFWWIEVGGLDDTIKDAERIRDELMKICWGVWDYIKNRAPERDKAECWGLEWVGSLPGKRENRRYLGDHILTQNDIRDGGRFADTIAFGGWPMDDHHPAAILYPGKPTVFHPAPSPYGIPYRSLYSRNVSNLLCAGRNISVTHAALSSTRVMATCAIIGQAAGTAAALCHKHHCNPRDIHSAHLDELQQKLMNDDAWLPAISRPVSDLARQAELHADGNNAQHLHDGLDRDRKGQSHAWAGPIGSAIEYRWAQPVAVGGARFTFDSNLQNDKRMPCSYPQRGDRSAVPSSLVRQYRLEAVDSDGQWQVIHRESNNYSRLVRLPLNIQTQGLRFVPEQTWGDEAVRVFAFEPMTHSDTVPPTVPEGPRFAEVVASTPAEHLAPPESGMEDPTSKFSHSA
ncbi:FAD-dependent oxidoreductase [Phycisphaerales bacterium AB-hyl4]|uniref:FAD-dependent oxidoreductase n=1 Tax=Natronomicrosphaera hydrolytica TaxID=3242702 RepID=A0ABV4U404_9BACT